MPLRLRHLFTLLLLALLALTTAQASARIWSKTDPAINLTHIFQGEINRRGKPTGFHAKFDGKIAEGARIVRVKSKANRLGVYTADVGIFDAKENRWKHKFSSMFPDHLSAKEVVEAIAHSYENREGRNTTPWRGPSGHGFPIEGYTLDNGRINTAYPIYIRDR